MNLYLAGENSKKMIFDFLVGGESRVNLFLAGQDPADQHQKQNLRQKLRPKILESFMQVTQQSVKLLPYYSDYMLDSGAFTMLQGNSKHTDLKQYVDSYAEYINLYQVKKYFELDIDPIIGYDEVVSIRKYLYKKTGVQPIPVWHKSRGMNNFKTMCKEYPYVALGGYVLGDFSKKEIIHFPKLIRYAHKHGAKIHGLGFTMLSMLPKCHFDSVDSTAWLSGNRFGHLYKFNGKTIIKISRPPGTRCKYKETAIKNFIEWCKFSKYAEHHL